METIIYVDVLFFINFVMDALCLFIVAVLVSAPFKMWRLLTASALGGIYSVYAVSAAKLFPLLLTALHLLAAYVICTIGIKSNSIFNTLKHALYFFLTCAALGGTLYAVYTLCGSFAIYNGAFYAELSAAPLIMSATVIAAVLIFFCGKIKARRKTRHCFLKLTLNGNTGNAYCIIDSGNFLVCPYTALPVAIITKSFATSLLSETEVTELEINGIIKGFRLIPVKGIGGKVLLPSFVPDEASICLYGEKKYVNKRLCIAIQMDKNSFDKCDGIVPEAVI